VFRPTRSVLAGLCLGLILLLPTPVHAQYAPGTLDRYEEMADGAELFDEIARTVQENFYDPALHGVDWDAMRATYRPRFLAAATVAERREIANALLGELHASHMQYFTPDQIAYYEIADFFSFSFRNRIEVFFPRGRVAYIGIGAYTTESDGKIFVSGLLDGLPAERAGLRVGDEILSVAGGHYEPVASFRGRAGTEIPIEIRRNADGASQMLMVTPVEIRPSDAFASAIEASARIIEAGGMKLGYVHMWCYFGARYHSLLQRLVATTLRDADALVLDLRAGWGGIADHGLSLFDQRQPTITFTGRDGRSTMTDVKWERPAAMLIDGGSRSAKEIIAYGFKKYRIGELIGSPTAKAVLGTSAYMMKDGSLLLLATSDVRVDGERLEGVGVSPTIPVEAPLPYRDGADPQLDRAIAVLSSRNPP
jgi:carboxyl-terminal processing protease